MNTTNPTQQSNKTYRYCKIAISLVILLTLIFVPSAKAAATTYTYTGNAFTYVGTDTFYGAPVTNISGYLTLSSALADSTTTTLTLSSGGGTITDYSFTDGRYVTDLANYASSNQWSTTSFAVTTSATGAIVGWNLDVNSSTANIITTNSGGTGTDGVNADPSQAYDAYNNNMPGTWSVTSAATPEPSTWALVLGGTGLLAVWRFRDRKKMSSSLKGICAAILWALISSSSVKAAVVLDQSDPGGLGGYEPNNYPFAETFTSGLNGTFDHLSLYLQDFSSSNTISFTLQNTSAGVPNGNVLTSDTIAGFSGAQWVTVDVSAADITSTAGTTYAYTLSSGTDSFRLFFDNASSSGAQAFYNTGSWQATGNSLQYQTYIQTAPEPSTRTLILAGLGLVMFRKVCPRGRLSFLPPLNIFAASER
jgi:hypothetical protein